MILLRNRMNLNSVGLSCKIVVACVLRNTPFLPSRNNLLLFIFLSSFWWYFPRALFCRLVIEESPSLHILLRYPVFGYFRRTRGA